MMADGTGCTAGLHQCIAVYPRNLKRQGTLFKFLAYLNDAFPMRYFRLGELIEKEGWILTEEGELRYANDDRSNKLGALVPPNVIRSTFTPINGVVPRKGAKWRQAKKWALAFHDFLKNTKTFDAQIDYGVSEMVKFSRCYRNRRLGGKTISEIFCGKLSDDLIHEHPYLDLGMCMFWNYKTNLPAPALTRLGKSSKVFNVKDFDSYRHFSEALIRMLCTSKIGRWSTARYARSRKYAMKIWPKELFVGSEAIMPRRF